MKPQTFSETVSAAVADLSAHGFDSIERLARWQREITYAAERAAKSSKDIDARLKDHLTRIFVSQITNGNALKKHKIARWTLERIKPQLRLELDRRIMASAQLIKLNREEMILRTLRRFSGWSTSLPAGGSLAIDKREEAGEIKKSLKQLPFLERRCIIDQSMKLKASLDNIIATDGGAIAAIWHSRHGGGYNNRPEHAARDGKAFVMRGNWAIEDELMRLNGHQYTDEIEMVGEFVYCSCSYQYVYALRDLPPDMVTAKGRETLAK
jgi:hypothetical protein